MIIKIVSDLSVTFRDKEERYTRYKKYKPIMQKSLVQSGYEQINNYNWHELILKLAWINFRKIIRYLIFIITTCVSNIIKHSGLLGLPWKCSASGMFAEAKTDNFMAIMRKRYASTLVSEGSCLCSRIGGTRFLNTENTF